MDDGDDTAAVDDVRGGRDGRKRASARNCREFGGGVIFSGRTERQLRARVVVLGGGASGVLTTRTRGALLTWTEGVWGPLGERALNLTISKQGFWCSQVGVGMRGRGTQGGHLHPGKGGSLLFSKQFVLTTACNRRPPSLMVAHLSLQPTVGERSSRELLVAVAAGPQRTVVPTSTSTMA